MDIYDDEVAFWDSCVVNYLYRNYGPTSHPNLLETMTDVADQLVVHRRRRTVIKSAEPEGSE
ncbi:hypothetical protein SAMN04487857_10276 [Pseudomonas sp. ok272]|nr:hypothetical protein SAMN04487857_10276 [Pseudomonas sp. ok272]SFM17196.1 hypothetical protein SAMN04487858_10177 [Pseudomonas sp. ok602]